MKFSTLNKISTEAVKKATGKNWDEWVELLDNSGAKDKSHTEIAHWLYEEKLIENSWWCQSVTVGYEYAIGRRVLGETKDVGFEVGVSKTLPLDKPKVWELITNTGLKTWLGEVKDWQLVKGFEYQTTDGTYGQIRSIDPGNRLRITWQSTIREKPTTLQLYLLQQNGKTALRFHHEKLTDSKDREAMRTHWQAVLSKLEELAITK